LFCLWNKYLSFLDPTEVTSLGKVYAEGRISPLLIGSVKSNMGHAEAAAGIAGKILRPNWLCAKQLM